MSISIRALTAEDAREVSEIYEPYVTSSSISFEEVAPSSAEMRGRLEKVTQNFPWWVAVDASSQVLGYAYVGRWELTLQELRTPPRAPTAPGTHFL